MTNEPYLVTTKRHMRDVIELHSACGWSPDEQTRLTEVLSDTNYFSFLLGDKEPIGYIVAYIYGKEAGTEWFGVNPNSRGKGYGRKLVLSGLNESRARGAETYDAYVSEVVEKNPAFDIHKKIDFTLVKSFSDYAFVEGKKVECITHHFQLSLIKKENRESDIDEE